jgi:hypothetical protein
VGFSEFIDVKLDFQRACDAVEVPWDERAFLSLLFNDPEVSERDAGAQLGFSQERTERVRRALRSDRRIGAGLRQFLAAYMKRPEKTFSNAVPKNGKAA